MPAITGERNPEPVESAVVVLDPVHPAVHAPRILDVDVVVRVPIAEGQAVPLPGLGDARVDREVALSLLGGYPKTQEFSDGDAVEP